MACYRAPGRPSWERERRLACHGNARPWRSSRPEAHRLTPRSPASSAAPGCWKRPPSPRHRRPSTPRPSRHGPRRRSISDRLGEPVPLLSEPVPGQADSGRAIRAALRHGLTAALKARDSDAVAALRTAMAAIDNAEAVPAPATNSPTTSVHFAGARGGPGSTEAARRQLSASDVRSVLRDQIAEHSRQAERYDTLGRADAAQRLRRQAGTLAPYLADDSASSRGRGALLRPYDGRPVDR